MNIKIVLAEDNNFLAQSIEEKLTFFDDFKFKYSAKNGAELIGKLEADHNVDVVLMDIQMPEMDGIKATTLIKNRYPQLKIIMLTV
ncbi:MAG: DNA-binding response regulator, partial [Flavobacteriales bacterium CG_4_9_14_3_um_filter_32_8]